MLAPQLSVIYMLERQKNDLRLACIVLISHPLSCSLCFSVSGFEMYGMLVGYDVLALSRKNEIRTFIFVIRKVGTYINRNMWYMFKERLYGNAV